MSASSYAVRVAEGLADREACFVVRKEVFVVEQGVPEDLEYDADAVHVVAVREDGVPIGAGRLPFGEAAAARNGGGPGVGPWGGSPSSRPRAGSVSGSRSCGASRTRPARVG